MFVPRYSIMNRTFLIYGLQKEFELKRGQLYDITATLSNPVKLVTQSVKCNFCQEVFSGKQYLEIHVRFRHATAPSTTHSISKAIP